MVTEQDMTPAPAGGPPEKQAAKMAKELDAAAKAVRNSVEAAQGALVVLMDATARYQQLLGVHAEALIGMGMDVEGQTGGGRSLRGPVVRVNGRFFLPAEPGALAAWVSHRVALTRLSRLNELTRALGAIPGRHTYMNRGDALLDGLSEVPPAAPTAVAS